MNTPESRTRKNALAFLDAFAHATGSSGPRPPGYLSISNLQLLGLKLGQGKDAMDALSPLEKRDQVNAFIWLQVAPLAQVSRALRVFDRAITAGKPRQEAFDDLLVETVEPFLENIGTEALEAALAQIENLDDIDASAVSAAPPADAPPDRERPDPNA